ncbi:hypothetical protein B0O99DRAFT_716582 [Bisporella sp. PMI_857]|nr:hypothetical protein B0O99DRAFT_716582 [Bisporella sp. PMI_857]
MHKVTYTHVISIAYHTINHGERRHKINLRKIFPRPFGGAGSVRRNLGQHLKPGSCGYFDENSDWQGIVQLTDAEAVKKLRLPALVAPSGGFLKDDYGIGTEWDVRRSESISEVSTTLKVAANTPAGITAKAGFEYQCKKQEGAVLVINGVVTKMETQNTTRLKDYVKANFEKIVGAGDKDVIKKKGIWVITKIYSAKQRAIAVMKPEGSKVAFDVDVGVAGQARIGPAASWWKSSTTSTGWIKSREASESPLESRWYHVIQKTNRQHLGDSSGENTEYLENDKETFVEFLEQPLSAEEDQSAGFNLEDVFVDADLKMKPEARNLEVKKKDEDGEDEDEDEE